MYRRIRELREDRDMTQKQMSDILRCSQRVYSNYERGDIDIPTEVLLKLADFHGVSTDYLLDRAPRMEYHKAMKLMGPRLSRVRIGVRDLGRSTAFYQRELGLRAVRGGGGRLLRDGAGFYLELSEGPEDAGGSSMVFSAAGFERMRERHERNGLIWSEDGEGYVIRDPDGHCIRIYPLQTDMGE